MLVGVAQAGQRGHLLFAPRKGLPALPQVVLGLPALKSLSQQVRGNFLRRTLFLFGNALEHDLERLVQLVIARFGFAPQSSGGEEEYSAGPSIPLY